MDQQAESSTRAGGRIVIDVDDDDDSGSPSTFDQERRRLMVRFEELGASRHRPLWIPDEGDLERLEAEIERKVYSANVIDLSDDDTPAPSPPPTRNIPSSTLYARYSWNGMTIEKGTVVEIEKLYKYKFGIQFLKVQLIRQEGSNVILQGIPYARARDMRGVLPLKRNEVVEILTAYVNDPREWTAQAAIEVNVEKVLCIRELQLTNTLYPHARFDIRKFTTPKEAEEMGILTCRWRMVTSYKSAVVEMKEGPFYSRSLQRLMADDVADPSLRVADAKLLNAWRGGKVRGGSHIPGAPSAPVVNLDDSDSPSARPLPRAPGQAYTFADVFCGAGGVSSGARSAGFKLKIACDMDKGACESYRRNFPAADLREMDVFDFVNSKDVGRVDVLHLSPPCQFWSPAHTREGKNDDENLSVLYATTGLIDKIRPRLVTVEQTFGLLQERFEAFFNLFLHSFTGVNYSVSYNITHLSNFGVPQTRKRLTMLAACPGEKLPPFPKATHSKTPSDGLLPWVTVEQALKDVRPESALHDVEGALRRAQLSGAFPKTPYNPNILLTTITTRGSDTYHPSGLRKFTSEELRALMTFPRHHEFAPRSIKRQIGNAYPPVAVAAMYKHLHSWLLKRDDMAEAVVGDNNVIILDDDDVMEEEAIVDKDDVIALDGGMEKDVDDEEDDDDDLMVMEWRERSVTLGREEDE
ncbi:hypothetical protein DL766_003131 [Monosporascus sp. MC13-8B]|uniref:DNA (cytosine-5-)-methyltransferase n=1 Tax=Monosporascus cannonballus TaxID=155416 RepID=A0ABY0H4S1_9PEZI|nr:hypothetical protein DL762_006668 [Monosporascus cannonballus]RYO94528.1 hypothetical protein DL763_004035 [Monosporascus cannonballus]RYP34143.1 hypothetical protein DL766_003131 [Monosporascus sp. MC13-8B]